MVQVNQAEDHLDEEIGWWPWAWVLGATVEVKLLQVEMEIRQVDSKALALLRESLVGSG